MLSRSTLRAAKRVPTLVQTGPADARGMATLRELELRLKSVRNIEKITKVCHSYHYPSRNG
jgi:F-type H+-transporting ATPase subunit gamma